MDINQQFEQIIQAEADAAGDLMFSKQQKRIVDHALNTFRQAGMEPWQLTYLGFGLLLAGDLPNDLVRELMRAAFEDGI